MRVGLLALGMVLVPSALAYTYMRPAAPGGRPVTSSPPRPAAAALLAAAPPERADSAAVDSASADARAADSLRTAAANARARAARLDPAAIRAAAERASGLRLVVSLGERQLLVLVGGDTLRVVPVGIGMDSTLRYRGRVWRFRTPPGERRVLGKEAEPVWVPPDWHYVEAAHERGLRLRHLAIDSAVTLSDGSRILVRDGDVGLVRPGEPFTPFALDEEIIQDGTLFVPPLGTRQRAITGELGRFRLDLGDGYLLHGTPYTESIGQPSSHGCIRIGDDDIAWLYHNVPVGTPVFTY